MLTCKSEFLHQLLSNLYMLDPQSYNHMHGELCGVCVCCYVIFAGLASLEMQLADEPVQGKWKISVDIGGNTETQEFKVEEYGKLQ